MKPYNVQVEVTTTYTVEVHAGYQQRAEEKAWELDLEEIEAQGSVDKTETTAVGFAEEIQRESEEDEDVNYRIAPEGQREFGGSAG